MSITVEQLSARLGLDCSGDIEMQLNSVANFSQATRSQLTFLVAHNKQSELNQPLECAVITTIQMADNIDAPALILSDNPQHSFAKAAPLVLVNQSEQAVVHQHAVIADSVNLDPTASVGAGAVIEKGVTIEAGVSIGANTFVGEGVRINEHSNIDANVTLYAGTSIGKHCSINSGTVIGSPGFGIVPDGKKWIRFPQLGRVIIGDYVDVGANCCIDRGALDDTIIESGVKLDNLIQIAHNVHIGEDTVIAGCAGIAGSTRIGRNCQIGGRASIQGHITIADNVVITACTFVNKSIFKPAVYSASLSAQENTTWLKNHARLHRLDKLSRQVSKLEKQFNHLTEKGEDSDK